MSLIQKFKDVLHAKKTSDGMFDEKGAIILDDTPMVEHLDGVGGQGSMRQMLDQYFASERYRALSEQLGVESFEEALDFGDENDEDHPGTPYSLEDERLIYEANKRIHEVRDTNAQADAEASAASSSQENDPPPSGAVSKKKVPPRGGSAPPNEGA